MIHRKSFVTPTSAMAIRQTIKVMFSLSWLARLVFVVVFAGMFAWLAKRFWESDSFWHREEYAATAGVVVACAGEYVADFKPFRNWPKHRKSFAKAATLLLILSLAFELLGLVRTSQISTNEVAGASGLAKQAEDDAANANERASGLEKQSGGLRLEVAKAQQVSAIANQRTSELQKESEDEQIYVLAPRRFLMHAEVEKILRSITPQNVDVVVDGDDNDTISFANDIIAACAHMGWGVISWPAIPRARLLDFMASAGYSVEVRKGCPENVRKAATLLENEIDWSQCQSIKVRPYVGLSSGAVVEFEENSPFEVGAGFTNAPLINNHKTKIRIIVGPKPPWPGG